MIKCQKIYCCSLKLNGTRRETVDFQKNEFRHFVKKKV